MKQKYGRRISWADLMILAGNCALESMGFKTFGFGGGRVDVWEPEEDVYWGPEDTWLGDERYSGDRQLDDPLGAVQMGLIYVNPEGPERQPRPGCRRPRHPGDVRPHGHERRGDGGADRRRAHLREDARRGRRLEYVGREPEGAPLEEQGLGWKNTFGSGKGDDAITSGLEVDLDLKSDPVGQRLLRESVRLRVGADGEPGWRAPVASYGPGRRRHGARRARPIEAAPPMMLTTDLALRFDPAYE